MKKSNNIIENSEKLLQQLASLSESELAELVLFHNRKYFEENQPEITDEAFDKLVEALRFINPEADALSQIGHKDELDAKGQFGAQVVHRQPMLSLDKCYNDIDFFKWADKIACDFVAMPKIDGVACSIIYSAEGKMLEASTRGDGKVGENVTKNALLIADLPSRLSVMPITNLIETGDVFEIRGEVFLPLSDFNEKFAKDFVSPRNLAAGFLKLKEDDRTKNHYLKFFPYDVRGLLVETEEEKFRLLERLGFSMMPWSVVKNDASATEIYFSFQKNRNAYDYEIDGVVFRANSLREQMRLGETAHHPRYAIAYKFQGESAQTKLVAVEWSVARSGLITPIAIVEPVFVSGASIARASLHNVGIFYQLDLREHSLVEINRRGGVIPYLERVLSKKGAPLLVPDRCPSCQGPVVIERDFLFCQNSSVCEEVVVAKLVHFCHVVGIEGLGDKIIRRLFSEGLLYTFADIFRLKYEQLLSLERMGEVLARKLLNEIASKKTIELPTFIEALGIYEIGSNVSEIITANFFTLARIRQLSVEDLLPLHGIGESIATALVEGLKQLSAEIDDLLTEVNIEEGETIYADVDPSHPLFGKSVVFTGKMAHLERKKAQEAVKKVGGKAPGAMSGHVDFLVIGDEGSPLLGLGKKSTKHKAAEKLIKEGHPLKIISENQFLLLIKK